MLKFKHLIPAAAAALALAAPLAQAAPVNLLAEGFEVDSPLTGWLVGNFSVPLGSTGWYQGDSGVFGAQAGSADSYAAANYSNTTEGGVIENWLVTPELATGAGARNAFSFYTRTDGSAYADRLMVLFNPTGSTNTGDFTEVLADINAEEVTGGFPTDWTKFMFQLGQANGIGRVAFVYTSSNSNNANYIGIDTVGYQVPEPESFGLVALALGGLLVTRRRKQVAA